VSAPSLVNAQRTRRAPLSDPSPRTVIWVLVTASTLCFATLGCYASILPGYITRELGHGPSTVGLVMGSTAVVAFFLRPVAGVITDRYGRRPAAVLGGVALGAGPLLLLGPRAIPILIVGRILVGVGDALSNTALMAWAIDIAPPERRGRAMATIGMSIWLGMAIGPQWGVAVHDAWGYDGVWVGAALVGLAAGLIPRLLPAPPATAPAAEEGAAPRGLSLPRGVALPGLVMILSLYGAAVFEAFGILHLVGRGVDDGAGFGGAASAFTVIAISCFVARFAGGALCDRIGPRPVGIVAILGLAAGDILISQASTFTAAAAASVVLGAALALIYPALGLIVARTVPAEERGVGIGLFSASMDVAFGLGAVAGGVVVAASSTSFALWSAAIVALLALPILATIHVPDAELGDPGASDAPAAATT
jgi:predicted MFS family arabinose efflux permease